VLLPTVQEMSMKVLRIVFFLLIVFLALPEFAIGYSSLANGLHARGDVWSVRHDYFGDAAYCLIAGVLAVFFAAWGAFRPGRHNWLRFLVAAGIVLFMAISIPSWYYPPQRHAEVAVQGKLLELQEALGPWCVERHRFPLTEQELAAALSRAHVSMNEESLYQHAGAPLLYQAVVVPNAKAGSGVPRERPAVLYYFVSADGTQAWVLATALPAPVSKTVITTGDAFVSLPPCSLEPAPPTPAPPVKK
jgi:hypothetical protein